MHLEERIQQLDNKLSTAISMIETVVIAADLKLHNIQQAAELTGLPYSYIREQLINGNLPYVPVGNVKMITQEGLRKLILSKTIRP